MFVGGRAGAVGLFVAVGVCVVLAAGVLPVGALGVPGSSSLRGAVSGRASSGGLAAPAVRGVASAPAVPRVFAVAAGGYAGYELLSNGRVWAWGDDLEGQIGTAGRWRWRSSPVLVRGIARVVAVAGGVNNAYAVERGGSVWAWGDDAQDELGDAGLASREVPARVAIAGRITAVAAGAFSAYALRRDGTVWAWGDDGWGQLGTAGAQITRGTPRRVQGLTHVVAVAGSDGDGYALRRDGTVWAWGDGSEGQLGDGCLAAISATGGRLPCRAATTPVRVRGLSDVRAIAAGAFTAYALRRDGSVWAWGSNDSGGLGNGVQRSFAAKPVRVGGLGNVVAIAAGGYSAYALMRDGTVWAWGRGIEGELGDGSPANRPLPTRVLKLTGVVKIAAGGETAYALDRLGRLWAWGSGLYGQLGNGLYGLMGNGSPYSLDEPTLVLNGGIAKRQPTTPNP